MAIEPEDVTLSAAKKAEDSNAPILHLYDWAGRPGDATISPLPGGAGALQTNFMEDSDGAALPIEHGPIHVAVRPRQILAIRVNYPAISGNGNGAMRTDAMPK